MEQHELLAYLRNEHRMVACEALRTKKTGAYKRLSQRFLATQHTYTSAITHTHVLCMSNGKLPERADGKIYIGRYGGRYAGMSASAAWRCSCERSVR